uniref:Uncharacterized protein n=1 Tax=Globodera pallida TaxID=36090 RepID=A0A183BMI1_GLOPA
MMAWAFAASVEQMRRALRVNNLPWLDKVHLLFLVSACVMVAVSLAFLLVGVLSTGRTRQSVFGRPADDGARRGGRISCVVAICLSFALNLLWSIVGIVTAILCFIYTILLMLCASANDCLDFGVFAPLFNAQNNSLKFCGANYAHIGSEAKYAELRHLFYSEISNMPLDQFSIDRCFSNGHANHHYQQQQSLPVNSGGRRWGYTPNHREDGRNSMKKAPNECRHLQIERRVEKRSVGAAVGNARRNSYQNSLHGSNNWLNYAVDVDPPPSAAGHHYQQAQQKHYAVGRVTY